MFSSKKSWDMFAFGLFETAQSLNGIRYVCWSAKKVQTYGKHDPVLRSGKNLFTKTSNLVGKFLTMILSH